MAENSRKYRQQAILKAGGGQKVQKRVLGPLIFFFLLKSTKNSQKYSRQAILKAGVGQKGPERGFGSPNIFFLNRLKIRKNTESCSGLNSG